MVAFSLAESGARPNPSLKAPTRYGGHRLAAPGHVCYRPSAASRRPPSPVGLARTLGLVLTAMPTLPVFQKVNRALVDLKEAGQNSVDIQPLLQFLEQVEADAPFDAEILRLNHETELARMKVSQDGKLEEFRSAIETAKVALTTSILVNGGATVALLALIGTFVSKAPQGAPSAPMP